MSQNRGIIDLAEIGVKFTLGWNEWTEDCYNKSYRFYIPDFLKLEFMPIKGTPYYKFSDVKALCNIEPMNIKCGVGFDMMIPISTYERAYGRYFDAPENRHLLRPKKGYVYSVTIDIMRENQNSAKFDNAEVLEQQRLDYNIKLD